MSKSIVREKSRSFAIRVIRLYKYLIDEKKEYVMSKQSLRSGTSIGANLAEQEFAISEADYLSKTSIALKEAAESAYWLDLLHETEYLTDNEYVNINADCNELIKMLVASVKSMKNKLGR